MSVKVIALALIGAAGFGTIAAPTWHALPHTTRVPLEVHYESPPQAWKIEEPLIYWDESRRRVAAYVRYLIVRD